MLLEKYLATGVDIAGRHEKNLATANENLFLLSVEQNKLYNRNIHTHNELSCAAHHSCHSLSLVGCYTEESLWTLPHMYLLWWDDSILLRNNGLNDNILLAIIFCHFDTLLSVLTCYFRCQHGEKNILNTFWNGQTITKKLISKTKIKVNKLLYQYKLKKKENSD